MANTKNKVRQVHNKHTVTTSPKRVLTEGEVNIEDAERILTQEEINARALEIAERRMTQHAKTWAELAKY